MNSSNADKKSEHKSLMQQIFDLLTLIEIYGQIPLSIIRESKAPLSEETLIKQLDALRTQAENKRDTLEHKNSQKKHLTMEQKNLKQKNEEIMETLRIENLKKTHKDKVKNIQMIQRQLDNNINQLNQNTEELKRILSPQEEMLSALLILGPWEFEYPHNRNIEKFYDACYLQLNERLTFAHQKYGILTELIKNIIATNLPQIRQSNPGLFSDMPSAQAALIKIDKYLRETNDYPVIQLQNILRLLTPEIRLIRGTSPDKEINFSEAHLDKLTQKKNLAGLLCGILFIPLQELHTKNPDHLHKSLIQSVTRAELTDMVERNERFSDGDFKINLQPSPPIPVQQFVDVDLGKDEKKSSQKRGKKLG